MITQAELAPVLKKYDLKNLTIGVLGGHSALDVCHGAKKHGFKTLAVCVKGREKTYTNYYKTRKQKGCIDQTIVVDSFKEIVKPEIQKQLQKNNTIFIHNRYFWVYCDFDRIENNFFVPIFGTRGLVRLEERNVPKNQYYLLKKAGIRTPRIFKNPKEIDRLVLVKVNEARRGYERAFFVASSAKDFEAKTAQMLASRKITEKALAEAVIEEYILGAHVNFNFFYSVVHGELELMGTDTRRQTNLDGYLRLPADQQLEILKTQQPKMIETGHIACTIKESLVEKAFALGEKFMATLKKECPPGMIGPFALQGAVVADEGKEDIVIFDVSMRIPGSPGTRATPYSGYLYGESLSYGERIALEIKDAIKIKKLPMVLT